MVALFSNKLQDKDRPKGKHLSKNKFPLKFNGFITRSRTAWLTSIFQMFTDFLQEADISNTLSNDVYVTFQISGSIKSLILEPSGNDEAFLRY